MNLLPGTIRLTSDGVVGTSGKPIRVFNVVLHSATGGGSTTKFCNGTTGAADQWFAIEGIADQDVIVNFAAGIRFPNGCFMDTDGNVEYCTITYTEEF